MASLKKSQSAVIAHRKSWPVGGHLIAEYGAFEKSNYECGGGFWSFEGSRRFFHEDMEGEVTILLW